MSEGYLQNYSPFDQPEEGDANQELPQIAIEPENRGKVTPPLAPAAGVLTTEELAAYEERLNILEHSLNNREGQARDAGRAASTEPEPNWPKFYPIIHYDITTVPERLRTFVHEAFACWFVMCLAFGLNWIICICLISVSDDSITSPGSKIALSSLYFFILVPLALDLDTMAVYHVLQGSGSTFAYLKIFISVGISCIFEFFLMLGLDDSGSVGLISAIDLMSNHHWAVGIFGVFVTLLFLLALLLHGKFMVRFWTFYRGTEEGEHMETNLRTSVAEYVIERMT
jgi:hypothetical protein